MHDPTRFPDPPDVGDGGAEPSTDLEAAMRLVALGDEAAFAALYDRLVPSIYRLVRLVLVRRPRADAEAAVRATFAEIWTRAAEPDLTAGLPVEAWALATAHRTARGLRSAATG